MYFDLEIGSYLRHKALTGSVNDKLDIKMKYFIPRKILTQAGESPVLRRCWWKKWKVMQMSGKILRAHGLEEIILLKCPSYPKQSADLMQSLLICQ